MAPIGFFQFLLIQRHLFFGRKRFHVGFMDRSVGPGRGIRRLSSATILFICWLSHNQNDNLG